VVANLHTATPEVAGKSVRYPGEETLRVRHENMEKGVPVDEALWKQLVEQAY
jgi:3-dehydro-L-gulonate 2-dehydrogenase